MKSFGEWLKIRENFTPSNIMAWAHDNQNKFYEKGVRDAQDDNYDPPPVGSQMSAGNKEQYILGWRSMGKYVPQGTFGRHRLSDREWFRNRLRMRNYGKMNQTNMIDLVKSDQPEYDDPDYDVNVG